MRSNWSRALLFAAGLLAVCVSGRELCAAEHRGQVTFGGLPLPGATVTAVRGQLKFVTTAGERGGYSFADLSDGSWSLRVDMLCFAPLERSVTVAAGATPEIWDLQMLPLAELTARATVALAQTNAPVLAANSGFRKADLKASGDAPKPVATAGEQPSPAPAPDSNQSASDVFAINGSVNNGAASQFGQSGAFGNNRNAGRSLYNGSLGVILDNSFLDARAFSLTGQDTPKPAFNHLVGIASFGGPLKIPHLLNSRTAPNFFFGYQLVRNRNANTQSALVPTPAQRAGDLSQSTGTALDPVTGAPFAGNVIPASRISAQARALLNLYPLPNFPSSRGYNYQIPLVGSTDQDSVQIRMNKQLGKRDQVFGSYAWQRTDSATPNLFAFRDTTSLTGWNLAANWQHRLGQRAFVHFQYQISRLSTRVTPQFANRQNVSGEAGIGGNNQEPVNWGPPRLSFSSGILGLSDAQAAFNRNQTGALAYDTTWNRRAHTLNFGADYKKQQFNALSQQDPRGTFVFNGAAAGNDFAGFLLGVPDTSSIAYGNADKYFRSSLYDAFFTDDWRAAPGLTLNLGARWEYGSPITELYGRLVNLDVVSGFGPVAPVIAFAPTGSLTGNHYSDSLVRPDKGKFQPRLGISWRPAGSSTVVRAGYGIYADTSVYQNIATQMAQQSPLSRSFRVQNSALDPLTLANGFIASSAITRNTFAIDPNYRVGYAHNWQVSIQRDLPGSLVATATYLGIKGTRAQQQFLPNTYPAGVVNPCPACASGYAYYTSNGNSTRESGQLQVRRRLHSGFTASLLYTYSKSIDDAALGGKGQGTAVIAQNWLDLSGERSLSNFDQRHLLSMQFQYSTGVGLRGGTLLEGWRGTLFKEWTLTSQINAGSGLPETPIFPATVQGTGVTGSLRPDYTGVDLYNAPRGFYLNQAAYTAPAFGRWGNAGRNTITGPGQFTLNASLGRTFRLKDKINADFRFDSTNALNHVTFPSWNTVVTSTQFGLPNNANAMRTMQATFRVRF